MSDMMSLDYESRSDCYFETKSEMSLLLPPPPPSCCGLESSYNSKNSDTACLIFDWLRRSRSNFQANNEHSRENCKILIAFLVKFVMIDIRLYLYYTKFLERIIDWIDFIQQ